MSTMEARMWRPAPKTHADDDRDLNDVRPRYFTADDWTVPGVKVRQVIGNGKVVAFNRYAQVRDALADRYGAVEIVHDELLPIDTKVECWPSCRGAFKTDWWNCGCPCGGMSHGQINWLLNYVQVSRERLTPCFLPGHELWRTTYGYVDPARVAVTR